MEWKLFGDWLLTKFQLQIVAPLLFVCYHHWKFTFAQKAISDKVDGHEKRLDKHEERLDSQGRSIIELNSKWESFRHGKSKSNTEKEAHTEIQ